MTLIPSQYRQLATMLDVTSLRQRVTAQNIANINTPAYKRLEVEFDPSSALKADMMNQGVSSSREGKVIESAGGSSRVDCNNVDIDLEIHDLNEHSGKYNTFVQILASKITQMRTAITGK